MYPFRRPASSVAPTLRVRARAAFDRRFGIDTRALAAFRISLGLLLLGDLLLRARHLAAFYTDAGVLPRALLVELYPGARYSLHAVSGALWVQGLLFVAAGGVALALLCGYRTRLATALSLLLLASLHARNPLVLNGGDTLLRRLLFWGVFLPLGEQWSLDARGDRHRPRRVSNAATAALLLQVVIVYTATGLLKLRSDRWIAGRELQHLFHVDQLTVGLGDVLAGFPTVLRLLAWLWLVLVLASVLLVVSSGRVRVLLVALYGGFHLGMLATMQLGLFPLISAAALLPFLPGTVWGRAASIARRSSHRLGLAAPRVHARRLPERALPGDRGRGPGSARGPGLARPDGNRAGPSDRRRRRVFSAAVVGLLVGALVWNAMGLGYVATPDQLAAVRDPAEHRWDMFIGGHRDDGWFVVPGRLEAGRQIDAYARAPLDWDRPPDLAGTYPSSRWLRYSLALSADERLLRSFADYLCWRWNRHHQDALVELTVYYNRIPVTVDGPGPTRRVPLIEHTCAPD